MRQRPGLIVVIAVLSALALVAVTWFAAVRFQSPAQRAAQAEPPAEQPVVVRVTRGDLSEQTTLHAQARAGNSSKLALPLATNGASVITARVLQSGEELSLGATPVWINDRPVIVLNGAFPLYRDLGPGDTGADVRLLQQNLRSLGYGVAVDGEFGSHTARALTALYRSIGASTPERIVKEQEESALVPSRAAASPSQQGSSPGTQAASAPERAAENHPTEGEVATPPKKEVYLPLSEVIVVPSLPVRAESIPAQGTVLSAENALIAVEAGQGQLEGTLPAAVAAKISGSVNGTARLGQDVVTVSGSLERSSATAETSPQTSEASGESSTGNSDDVQDRGRSSSSSRIVLTPTNAEIPASWLGREDVLVTLDLMPPLQDVLTVPQSAIASDASGTMSVLRKSTEGDFEQIPVQMSACVAGTCAIEAEGILREGDEVRVDHS